MLFGECPNYRTHDHTENIIFWCLYSTFIIFFVTLLRVFNFNFYDSTSMPTTTYLIHHFNKNRISSQITICTIFILPFNQFCYFSLWVLSLAISPWLGKMSTSYGYGYRYGKKWRVLHPCYQDYWHLTSRFLKQKKFLRAGYPSCHPTISIKPTTINQLWQLCMIIYVVYFYVISDNLFVLFCFYLLYYGEQRFSSILNNNSTTDLTTTKTCEVAAVIARQD